MDVEERGAGGGWRAAEKTSIGSGDKGQGNIRLLNSAGLIRVIQAHPSVPLFDRAAEGVGVFFDDGMDIGDAVGCFGKHGVASLGAEEIQLFLSAQLLEGFG